MSNVYFFIVDANTSELTNECIRRIIKNVKCISNYKIIICRNDIYGKENNFQLAPDINAKNIEIIHPTYEKIDYTFNISKNDFFLIAESKKFNDKKYIDQQFFPLIIDGDVRHAMSIQYALDNYNGDIIFVDSDCFINQDIQCLFSNKICSFVYVNEKQNINYRIQPYLMRINSIMTKQKKIKWLSYDTLEKYKTSVSIPIIGFQIPFWIDSTILRCHLFNGAIFKNELIVNNEQFDIIPNTNICTHLGGASYKKYSNDDIKEFISK